MHILRKKDVNMKISVYCNRIGDACYGVLRNYSKHLSSKHKIKRAHSRADAVIESKKICSVSVDHLLAEDNNTFESDSKFDTGDFSRDDSVFTESYESCESLSTLADAKDGICINLSIESVDGSMQDRFNCDENSEQLIYTQISAQITKILQAVLIFNESVEEVIFELDQTERVLQTAKITGDGNCMFRALAHQLFCEKLNSAIQNGSTKKLRADAVRYINENFEQFIHEIKGCVFDLNEKDEIDVIQDECHSYVDHILSEDGSWGGSESIEAVYSIYSVNILLFNEYGPCYYVNAFNSEYISTVVIAYRLENGVDSKQKRNHYDSVSRIKQDDIFACSKLLWDETEKRKILGIKTKRFIWRNED